MGWGAGENDKNVRKAFLLFSQYKKQSGQCQTNISPGMWKKGRSADRAAADPGGGSHSGINDHRNSADRAPAGSDHPDSLGKGTHGRAVEGPRFLRKSRACRAFKPMISSGGVCAVWINS